MRNETFYATAAQVLPTLLIAFVIEIGSYIRERWDLAERTIGDGLRGGGGALTRLPESLFKSVDDAVGRVIVLRSPKVYIRLAASFGGMVLLGEFAAVLVLFLGPDGWLPIAAGPICLLSMIGATAGILGLPLVRRAKRRSYAVRPPD